LKTLLDRLGEGDLLISDGAMGTMLHAQGLTASECPESWCASHPELVRNVAAAYVEGGAEIIGTNSFGGSTFKLRAYGLAARCAELNKLAAQLAKQAIAGRGYVAASVGPTGRILDEEGGDVSGGEIFTAFSEQIVALAEGGADAICIETMASIREASQAIRAAKDKTRLPVICTFTFTAGVKGFRTIMGLKPSQAALAARDAGADVVGANCGTGIASIIEIVAEMRAAAPHVPILAQANAGAPVVENEKTLFKETPEYMASRVAELIKAGANLIGGCCGTTPAHVRAMAEAVRHSTKT
jgi:5-methyltetrahydrofolate--homocysteine methyltransferase